MEIEVDKIRSALLIKLNALEELPFGPEKISKTLALIDRTIAELDSHFEQRGFIDAPEEIRYYKFHRPQVLAMRIEEVMRYNLQLNLPIGTAENKIEYYEEELQARNSCFRMNAFLYQYYKNGLSDLDGLFFIRNGVPVTIPVTELLEPRNAFSTPMSDLFAKFTAYEHVQVHILEQITTIKNPPNISSPASGAGKGMKWTGDAVNIVELAYGLWLTGQIDNGNASLNQIVRWLEANLDISIGIVQRRFSEIERRKRLSPTRFIDQMKEAVLKKIESGNA